MFAMITSFILLKKCFRKALLNLSIEHDISPTEFLFLNELKYALEPIKLAIEALCYQGATLLTAKGIPQILVTEMKKRSSSLAKDVLCAIKNRLQQRQHDLVNVMRVFKI